MNTLPWHSSGNLALSGGLLQWRWSGHCSKDAIDTAIQQVQQGEELLNDFLRKQEDIISLFIQGLVQGPGVVVPGDSHDMHVHQKSEFEGAAELFPIQSMSEEDRDCQEVAKLSRIRKEVQQVSAGPNNHSISQSPNSAKMAMALEVAYEDRQLKRGGTILAAVKQVGLHHRRALNWMHWWASLEEPRREGFLAEFERSSRFQAISAIVILLNTGFILQNSNYAVKNLTDDEPLVFVIAEACFLFIYIAELVFKLTVHQIFFFCNDDMAWNLFDLLIILFSSANFLTKVVDPDGTNSNLSFLRTFRLLKLSKIFRIFRLIVLLRDLRIMLNCVLNSFMSMVWCFALLALIMVVFAIFFVQSLTRYLIHNGEENELVVHLVHRHFPSVQDGMITLFMISTGGEEWSTTYRSLRSTGFLNCAMMIFFIGFFHVSIFNIATGLFVEKAMKFSRPDQEMEILEHRREAMAKVNRLKALCSALDLDQSGTIEREEFLASIKEPHIRFALNMEGLDIMDVNAFFDMLASVHGNVQVDLDTFIAGCLRMRGLATSVDLQTLGFELKVNIEENQALNHQIISHINQLQSGLRQISNQIRAQPFNENHEERREEGRIQGRDPDLVRFV